MGPDSLSVAGKYLKAWSIRVGLVRGEDTGRGRRVFLGYLMLRDFENGDLYGEAEYLQVYRLSDGRAVCCSTRPSNY